MGAGPDPKALRSALIRAQTKAEEHTKKTGLACSARVIRASNGEAAIVYDMINAQGAKITLLSLTEEAGRNLSE